MFNKKETVCFFGASIITHGHAMKEVFQYVVDNHKEDRVKFLNCGVPGDAACRALHRLYEDLLIHNPNKIVMMIGHNDIERKLYVPGNDIENLEEKKKYYLDLYKKSVREVVERCTAFGAEMILCTLTPVQAEKSPCKGACNEALGICNEFLRELAKEKNLLLVDFNTAMTEMLDKDIMSKDGVHPTELGHHIMAQTLLKALGYINETDYETMPVFSEKNEERFKTEQTYRSIKMVEWTTLYDFMTANPDASYSEKIELIKDKRKDSVNVGMGWFMDATDNYIKYSHKITKLQEKLLKETIEMYD